MDLGHERPPTCHERRELLPGIHDRAQVALHRELYTFVPEQRVKVVVERARREREAVRLHNVLQVGVREEESMRVWPMEQNRVLDAAAFVHSLYAAGAHPGDGACRALRIQERRLSPAIRGAHRRHETSARRNGRQGSEFLLHAHTQNV